MKKKILFLCTGNSCRSQMAEGWGKALKGEFYDFFSAGIKTHGLNLSAVKVMANKKIDISHHFSKTLEDLQGIYFDVVFTVCGHADETCPIFPKKTKKIHIGFEDPPKLAKDAKTEREALLHYSQVRDKIRHFIETIEQYIEE